MRLDAMRTAVIGMIFIALVAACGTNVASRTPSEETLGTVPPPTGLRPLPGTVSGIPETDEFTVEISAVSPDSEMDVGVEHSFDLGHCGLTSPVDIDGSL